jgi:hypothetical protein
MTPNTRGKIGLPAHGTPYLEWTQPDIAREMISHNGVSGQGFSYMFPVPKYAEAYSSMTGPGWGGFISYLNYNHGNQPYMAMDSGINTAFHTPAIPNWYALSKVSPKSSAPGVQLAQLQLAQAFALRNPLGTTIGYP